MFQTRYEVVVILRIFKTCQLKWRFIPITLDIFLTDPFAFFSPQYYGMSVRESDVSRFLLIHSLFWIKVMPHMACFNTSALFVKLNVFVVDCVLFQMFKDLAVPLPVDFYFLRKRNRPAFIAVPLLVLESTCDPALVECALGAGLGEVGMGLGEETAGLGGVVPFGRVREKPEDQMVGTGMNGGGWRGSDCPYGRQIIVRLDLRNVGHPPRIRRLLPFPWDSYGLGHGTHRAETKKTSPRPVSKEEDRKRFEALMKRINP